MATCTACGTANPPDARFCEECGTPLRSTCPNCGGAIRPDARFCGSCGTRLVSEAIPTAGAPASSGSTPGTALAATQPSTALGPANAERPATAERRFVSVLFADLVGFTPYAEERDPEEVRETLTRYFDIAREIVERYGGTVEKFIGDAVMAVWGAPVAREDDAERAVRAALDLADAVPTLGTGIAARAGVLSGEAAVTVGATGQGMVAGDLVNTAARLQAAAEPGTVLVGEATMRSAVAAVSFEALGPRSLKGKADSVAVYRALRVVAQRGGAGRSDLPEPPFVGRHDELRLLKELLVATGRDRRARLVSVTGPAGIGKSRLAWELEKYVDGVVEDIYWHRGRSPSYGEGVSFWALGEMIRGRAGLVESDDEPTTRARVGATVAEHVPDERERGWIAPALLALLGIEPAPPGGREMLFAAWRTFFERVAAGGTTVLVFEDLHWADPGLLDFIEHVLEWSRGVPIFVLTLARPELFERRAAWGSGWRSFNALALDPLTDEQMRELLAGLAPGLPDRAVAAVLARADGIPLYAVETMRMLVADGRVRLIEGVYQPTGDLGDLAVPESLRSLIASRLDGLDPVDRALLGDASVLGRAFTLPDLAAMDGPAVRAGDLEARLHSLVRRELLALDLDVRSPERGQYAFVQSLIREVAYATLSRRDRRERHLAAARHLERAADPELAGVLAGHYLAAHEASTAGPEADAVAAQARVALRAAAERAAALGGHDQAVTYLGQAVAVTGDPGARAELLERQADEALIAGRYEPAEAAAREAVALLTALGDPVGIARTRSLVGVVLLAQARIAEATADTEAALEALPEGSDVAVQALILTRLTRAYYRGREHTRALEVSSRALALSEPRRLDAITAEALINRGTALQWSSRMREGAALLRAGADLAMAVGDTSSALRGWYNLSFGLLGNDNREALAISTHALEVARRVGDLSAVAAQTTRQVQCVRAAGEPLHPMVSDLDDLLARGISHSDRLTVLTFRLSLAYELGEDASDLEAQFAALMLTTDDPQERMGQLFLEAFAEFLSGSFADAGRKLVDIDREFPEAENQPMAVMSLAWAGDVEAADRAAERLTEETSAAATAAWARAARADVAALHGRPAEALPLYREAMRSLRTVGDHFTLAIVQLSMLRMLGPQMAEARSAGEEALRTFERLGERPVAAMVRELLHARAVPLTPA